jgi:hypothetical protein
MTVEEMAEEYADKTFGMYYPTDQERVQVEQAFLAGLNEGRPRWHKVADGDLPTVHATFLNENCDKVEYLGKGKWEAYSEYYEEYVEIEPPIAWCEKPEYTGVENGRNMR